MITLPGALVVDQKGEERKVACELSQFAAVQPDGLRLRFHLDEKEVSMTLTAEACHMLKTSIDKQLAAINSRDLPPSQSTSPREPRTTGLG